MAFLLPYLGAKAAEAAGKVATNAATKMITRHASNSNDPALQIAAANVTPDNFQQTAGAYLTDRVGDLAVQGIDYVIDNAGDWYKQGKEYARNKYNEVVRNKRDTLLNSQRAFYSYFGSKDKVRQIDNQKTRNKYQDMFDDNFKVLVNNGEGSSALKQQTIQSAQDFMNNILDVKEAMQKEGKDSPTVKEMMSRIDFGKGSNAAKSAIQMLAAQSGQTSESSPFISNLISMLTSIVGVSSPWALAAINAAELVATIKPLQNALGSGVKWLWGKLTGKKEQEKPVKREDLYDTDRVIPVNGHPQEMDPEFQKYLEMMKYKQRMKLFENGVFAQPPEYGPHLPDYKPPNRNIYGDRSIDDYYEAYVPEKRRYKEKKPKRIKREYSDDEDSYDDYKLKKKLLKKKLKSM